MIAETLKGSSRLPPLSVLDNLTVEANGFIFDDNLALVGRVVEGNLSFQGGKWYICDANGNVFDALEDNLVGRAETVAPVIED